VAYVNQPPEGDEMRRRPRDPRARILDRRMLLAIAAGGLTLAVLTGVVFLLALGPHGVTGARTLALVCWLVGHATLGVAMGWGRRPIVLRDLARNPAMLLWAAAAVVFAVGVLIWPPLQAALHAGPVPIWTGVVALSVSLVTPFWMEGAKRVRARVAT